MCMRFIGPSSSGSGRGDQSISPGKEDVDGDSRPSVSRLKDVGLC